MTWESCPRLLSQVLGPQEESCLCLFPVVALGVYSGEPPKARGCGHCNALQRSGSFSVGVPVLFVFAPQGPTGTRNRDLWSVGFTLLTRTPCPRQLLGGDLAT